MKDWARTVGAYPTGENADPARMIDWFDYFGGKDEDLNEFRFLSNFYADEPFAAAIQDLQGETICAAEWQTGEHAFAAAKASRREDAMAIRDMPGPQAAKTAGRQVHLRPDWELLKYDVMAQVLAGKFTEKSHCGRMLLSTGSALLVEGTWWEDQVWGVDLTKSGAPGRNWLGRLLMARRAELRSLHEYGLNSELEDVLRRTR